MIFQTMGHAIQIWFTSEAPRRVFEKTTVAKLLAEPLRNKSLCQNPGKNVFKIKRFRKSAASANPLNFCWKYVTPLLPIFGFLLYGNKVFGFFQKIVYARRQLRFVVPRGDCGL